MKDAETDHFSAEEFIARLRTRDQAAVEQVVHAYTKHLYRAALGLGFNATLSHELVQTVWAAFFDAIPGFQGHSHIRTFIFGILYNKACELRRQENRLDTKDPIEDILDKHFDAKGMWVDPPINPEQFLAAAETRELIEKCLETLPLNQRMAFTLKEIEENESSEICKILNITITNLGVLLYRARNHLREYIEGKVKTR